MKKVYLLITAICLTALTSCVKEESYEVSTAYLDVTLDTRATSTQEQGDGIKNVMLWAFKCENIVNGVPQNVQQTASGWRTVTGLNTYQSLNVHVELPLCDGDSQDYVLVAVINKDEFGTVKSSNGSALTLGPNTSFEDLTTATFDVSAKEWWNAHVSSENPVHMPVSHWTTFNITNANTHPDNCKAITLDVFRAVAKTQLYMAKMSDGFNLEVVEAKLSYTNMPVEGVLLSALSADRLKQDKPTPAWFGSAVPVENNWGNSRQLMNVNGAITKPEEGNEGFTNTVKISSESSADYQFVGSTFMHESADACVQTDDGTYDSNSIPNKDTGYYLEIAYKIDGGDEIHKFVALPAVVRNHDYQVRALVDAGGKLSLTLQVEDWDSDSYEWNYTDVVEVDSNNGTLSWDVEPSPATGIDNVYDIILDKKVTKASCEFKIVSPADATWVASFVGGDINAFKFEDSNGNKVSTISGKIGEKAKLTICTTNDVVYDTKNAYLDIVVITNDGRTLSATNALTGGIRYRINQALTM